MSHVASISPSGSAAGALPCRFHLALDELTTNTPATAATALASPRHKYSGAEAYTHVMSCTPEMTFEEIKAKIWRKMSLPLANLPLYTFQLATGEMTFEDEEQFSRLLEMNEIFREDDPVQSSAAAVGNQEPHVRMLECVVLHKDHHESKHVRERRSKTPYGIVQHRGTLSQRSEGMLGASWRQRIFLLQDMTLVSFESEGSSTATDSWPLGAIVAAQVESTDRNHSFAFELRKPAPPNGTLVTTPAPTSSKHPPVTPVFYSETLASLQEWIGHINRLHLRRVKLITVTCCQELDSRGLESIDGIFRMSGSKDRIGLLQSEYDAGKLPNLGLIEDEHVLTGFIKNNIRNLEEPLISFDMYAPFLRVMADHPLSATDGETVTKRVAALRAVVEQLPQTNQGLLSYLMSFLSRVSDAGAVNRMSASNLAIVFAPNLLRPRVENVGSIMSDAKPVQDCVEALIRDARDIWPNYTNTRRTSRLAGFQGRAAPPALPPPPLTPTLESVCESPQPDLVTPMVIGVMLPSMRGLPPARRVSAAPPPLPASYVSPSAAAAAVAAAAAARENQHVTSPPPLPVPFPPPTRTLPSPPPRRASTTTSPTVNVSAPPALPSVRGPMVAAAVSAASTATPEDLTAVVEHGCRLANQWSNSLGHSHSTLQSGLASLLAAHTSALGSLPLDASSDAASTVQRCLGILSSDMLRFELDLANLNRFVLEQTRSAQAAAANKCSLDEAVAGVARLSLSSPKPTAA